MPGLGGAASVVDAQVIGRALDQAVPPGRGANSPLRDRAGFYRKHQTDGLHRRGNLSRVRDEVPEDAAGIVHRMLAP